MKAKKPKRIVEKWWAVKLYDDYFMVRSDTPFAVQLALTRKGAAEMKRSANLYKEAKAKVVRVEIREV